MIPTWHSSLYFGVVSIQSLQFFFLGGGGGHLGKWVYIFLYERNFYRTDLNEIYIIFYIVSRSSNLLKVMVAQIFCRMH
jgi:hypothetical protein